MEFVRECGSIQADLARRAGSLLRQYSLLAKDLPEAQKYDATLAVAVLGLLLVNCHEAMANMETAGAHTCSGPRCERSCWIARRATFLHPKARSVRLSPLDICATP